MENHVRIERIGDVWAVMQYSEHSGEWMPVSEWDTEEEAWKDLEKWEAVYKAKGSSK